MLQKTRMSIILVASHIECCFVEWCGDDCIHFSCHCTLDTLYDESIGSVTSTFRGLAITNHTLFWCFYFD